MDGILGAVPRPCNGRREKHKSSAMVPVEFLDFVSISHAPSIVRQSSQGFLSR
jgi:hypothetical protein